MEGFDHSFPEVYWNGRWCILVIEDRNPRKVADLIRREVHEIYRGK